MKKGILTKAIAGFYYVSCNNEVYECKARGNFRKTGISPVVGDNVEFELTDDKHGVIERILQRKNLIARPLVANIDKLFIVSAFETPSPDTLMIDRLTAIARFNNIEPIIVFNKADMGDFTHFYRIYCNSGFKTYIVSAINNNGISELKQETCGCISAFSGNSGVGKSSIINSLFPELQLKTGEVSERLGRGRHTTRHTEIFAVEQNGFVVDTPGFAAVEATDDLYRFKLQLADCFEDFDDFKDNCKYTGCTHTCEKGCSVIDAVNNSLIEKSRHESYKIIANELKDVKEWQQRNKK